MDSTILNIIISLSAPNYQGISDSELMVKRIFALHVNSFTFNCKPFQMKTSSMVMVFHFIIIGNASRCHVILQRCTFISQLPF